MSATKRAAGQFEIRLHPQHGGAFTHWRVTGSTPTAVPERQLDHLMQSLSLWSGWPVELVLPVEVGAVAWFSWWSDALANIRAEHLRLRCIRSKHRGKKDG